MTNLEDIQRKLSTIIAEKAELGARVFELQTEIDKLKKQPEPCPLEEGKQVPVYFHQAKVNEWMTHDVWRSGPGTVNVEEDGHIVLRWDFGSKSWAIEQARDLIRRLGKRVD